ncbi:MAG TPA: hypothetical protein ENK07_02580 [Bacteroidetes bacterium]|nr:hypothetical protein [Bacteroidota bacterium]
MPWCSRSGPPCSTGSSPPCPGPGWTSCAWTARPGTAARWCGPSRTRAAEVKFVVRDVLGRIVDEKVYKGQRPGVHKITWGGTDASGSPLASGVYLLSVRTGEFERTVRVLLLK